MTERRIDLVEALNNRDLELITDYLANELDPAQVAEVRRRLEEDPGFRDFAAPIVAAWSVPPRWQRHPMPRAELERSWDEFTRRAGFLHQRRKTRRRWMMFLGLALLTGAAVASVYAAKWYSAWRTLAFIAPSWDSTSATAVADSGRLMHLADGTRVLLDSGSRLDVQRSLGREPSRAVRLEGGARFFVTRLDSATAKPLSEFMVWTTGGVVHTRSGEFHVRAVGDTTEVQSGPANATAPSAVDDGSLVFVWALPVRVTDVGMRSGERARAVLRQGVTRLDSILPDTILPVQSGAARTPLGRQRLVKTVAPAPNVPAHDTAAPPAVSPGTSGDSLLFSMDSSTLKRLRTAFDSGGKVDMWEMWMLLAKPIADTGRTMTLASGTRVSLEAGARAYLMPHAQLGPGRIIAIEGSASLVVPQLTPFGSSLATSFMIHTRAGMVTAANAAAFKVSARQDTTDVEVFALAPEPNSDRPPVSRGTVMLMSLSLGPQSIGLVLVPGQAGRMVQGSGPVRLKESP